MKNNLLFCLSLHLFSFWATHPGFAGEAASTQKEINTLFLQYQKSSLNVPTLTVEEALTLKDKEPNVIFVDVRTSEEQEVSMIPNAIPAKEFDKNRKSYAAYKIIAYCTIGSRSGKYVKNLRKNKFDAYNLKGSILSWVHADQPLVDQKGPTRGVHVYESKWNLLPEGYTPIWKKPWWKR